MLLFEWKNKRVNDNQDGIAIENGYVRCPEDYVAKAVFRNFPKLEFNNIRLINCVFVNCDYIQIDDGLLMDCSFNRINSLFACRSDIVHCKFEHLKCDSDFLITMEDCEMTQCLFRDVELRNDAYLCEGVDKVEVKNCVFRDCSTTRGDRKMFHGIRLGKGLFKRKAEIEILDERTCKGLHQVKHIG